MSENKVTVVARSTAGTAVELAVRLSEAMARSTIQRWETLNRRTSERRPVGFAKAHSIQNCFAHFSQR